MEEKGRCQLSRVHVFSWPWRQLFFPPPPGNRAMETSCLGGGGEALSGCVPRGGQAAKLGRSLSAGGKSGPSPSSPQPFAAQPLQRPRPFPEGPRGSSPPPGRSARPLPLREAVQPRRGVGGEEPPREQEAARRGAPGGLTGSGSAARRRPCRRPSRRRPAGSRAQRSAPQRAPPRLSAEERLAHAGPAGWSWRQRHPHEEVVRSAPARGPPASPARASASAPAKPPGRCGDCAQEAQPCASVPLSGARPLAPAWPGVLARAPVGEAKRKSPEPSRSRRRAAKEGAAPPTKWRTLEGRDYNRDVANRALQHNIGKHDFY